MTEANELNAKIAEQTITAISGQIDFLHTLSLAMLGAVFAFMLQIALHNKDSDAKRVGLSRRGLLFWGVLFEGSSVLCSLLAKGALTSSIAPIYRVDFKTIDRLADAAFTGSVPLIWLTQAQYWSFFLGVVALLVFLWVNRGLLR